MVNPESRKSGLPDWIAIILALAGFLLFLYVGQDYFHSAIFARLLGP